MNIKLAGVFVVTAVCAMAIPAAQEPALRIIEPQNGVYLGGEVLVRAAMQPAEQPVKRMSFFVDGRLVCTVDEPPFECAWNAGVEIRPHFFRVVALLPDGNRVIQIARTKGVDYAEPENVDVVHVTASVLDNGKFVTGLPREAFRVYEDDVLQPIDHFAAETSPLELVIGTDISLSMVGSIGITRDNVKHFLSALPNRPDDRFTLVVFNDNFFVLARPSVDLEGRLKALDGLVPWGQTSLHEALMRSFDLLGRQARRRGLVMFTDGDDTTSHVPREAVLRRSETSDAVVYLIGQGRAVDSPSLRDLCTRLAEISGGRAFFPRDAEQLGATYDAILEEMSHQYLLSYVPPSTSRDSSFHKIRVEVDGGYEVRARQGYRMAVR
jgi:Ca-activated chloride channel family protein